MELKDAFVQSCSEMLPMFGLTPELLEEKQEKTLNSAEEVNILIGLTNGMKGNIVIGLSRETALTIVSGMMGGMEISALDDMAKSALGELTNMLTGSTVGRLGSEKSIDLSPPSMAVGKNIFLMISRVPARKLVFGLNGAVLNIAFSIE